MIYGVKDKDPETKKREDYEYIKGDNVEYKVDREDGEEVYAGSWVRDYIKRLPENKYLAGFTRQGSGLRPVVFDLTADKHLHGGITGKTGAGKSTLMRTIMIQKIRKGHGILFVDAKKGLYDDKYDNIADIDYDDIYDDSYEPDNLKDIKGLNSVPNIGEDALKLIKRIPEDRKDDIIYINAKPIGDHSVSFNPLDLPDISYKSQSTLDEMARTYVNMIEQLMKSLGDGGEDTFGAKMKQVFTHLVVGMIKSPNNYDITDVFHILTNKSGSQDDIQDALDAFYELEAQHLRDEWLETAIDNLRDISDTTALERRLSRVVVESSLIRSFIGNDENDIDFVDVLAENKIVILDIQTDINQIKQIVASFVIESIRTLTDEVRLDKEFYIYADEFQNTLGENCKTPVDYEKIFRQGRSKRVLMMYGTQSPSSLQGFLTADIKTNTNVFYTGEVAKEDVDTLQTFFKKEKEDADAKTVISDLDKDNFEFLARSPKNSVGKIQSCPDLPPVRKTREAVELIYKNSGPEGYGSKQSYHNSVEESVNDKLIQNTDGTTTEDAIQIVETAVKYERELDSKYQNYATEESIQKVLEYGVEKDLGTDYTFSDWIERYVNMGFVAGESIVGKQVYQVSEKGRKEYLSISTGKSGSGGKGEHRTGLSKTRDQLPKYGIHVTLPDQGGSEDIADGIARVFDEDLNPYPVEKGERVRIEYEKSTTLDNPYMMQSNLAKAEDDELVVFASVQTKTCEKVKRVLDRGGYKSDKNEYGYNLYTKDKEWFKDGNVLPLRKITAPDQSQAFHNRWYLSDDKSTVVAYEKTSTGDLTESIELPASLDWSKDDFPAYAVKDGDGWSIYESGDVVDTYDSISDIHSNSNYRKVIKPWNPDQEFVGGDPDNHQYMIMLVNSESESIDKPQIYNGDYTPIDEYEIDNNTEEGSQATEVQDKDTEREQKNTVDEKRSNLMDEL